MGEPQTIPYDVGAKVRDKRTCATATVVALVSTTVLKVVLEPDGGGTLTVARASRWELLPDELAVATVPLAAILDTFVTGWRRDRPMKGSGFRRPDPGDVEPINPYTYLAAETGLSREQIRQASRPEEHPLTDFCVADALVAAVGASQSIFYDGTLEVVDNPRRCCGGST